MQLERCVKATLTPIELDVGDVLRFRLTDGSSWQMELLGTEARVLERGRLTHEDPTHYRDDILVYGMTAAVRVNGREHVLERQVGNQASFYEPWLIDDVRVWFDAAACAFIHPPRSGGILHEKDWAHRQICSPGRAARFAVQQADRPIAPEPIGRWFEGQPAVPDIRACYAGQDCWMGPYNGGAAHCGLDVNMARGTRLIAPIAVDDQYMFNDRRAGSRCDRWRGRRRWRVGEADEADWIIQSHHLDALLVPERRPLARGTVYAAAAGTGVGLVAHTHFAFRVIEQGGDYMLDPWILFWAAGQG